MAAHVHEAFVAMVEGQRRWLNDGDVFGGRAALMETRALVEFLVGRPGKRGPTRKTSDIWPSDYAPAWSADASDVALLHRRLKGIDQRLAHLSLQRAEIPDDPPETWPETVDRIVRMMADFVEQTNDSPAHDQLRGAIV